MCNEQDKSARAEAGKKWTYHDIAPGGIVILSLAGIDLANAFQVEIDRLEDERDKYRAMCGVPTFKAEGCMAIGQKLIEDSMEIARLKAENKRLKEFVQHLPDCKIDGPGMRRCTCGLKEAKEQ